MTTVMTRMGIQPELLYMLSSRIMVPSFRILLRPSVLSIPSVQTQHHNSRMESPDLERRLPIAISRAQFKGQRSVSKFSHKTEERINVRSSWNVFKVDDCVQMPPYVMPSPAYPQYYCSATQQCVVVSQPNTCAPPPSSAAIMANVLPGSPTTMSVPNNNHQSATTADVQASNIRMHAVRLPPPRSFCVYICLSVCERDYSKSCRPRWIFMKFLGRIGLLGGDL